MTAGSRAPATAPEVAARVQYRSSQQRGQAVAELCRLQISRVPCLVMLATAWAAGTGVVAGMAGVGLIVASCAIGAAMNDRADVVSDQLNGRHDRPLVSGALGPRDVGFVIAGAAAVVVVAELFLPQPNGLLVAAAASFVAWGSACAPLALQRRGLVGLVALAAGYLVLPILLVIGIDRWGAIMPLALLGAGVLAHKDVRDEVGDRAAGKRTLLVHLGYRRMSWAAVGLGITGVALLVFTIGAGAWVAPAVGVLGGLLALARAGHAPPVWLAARGALVLTAVLVGIHAAGGWR